MTHGHRSRVFLLEKHRLKMLMNLLNGRDKFIHLGGSFFDLFSLMPSCDPCSPRNPAE